MIKYLSLAGLATGFLMISPSFRGSVLDGVAQTTLVIAQYSPWSYIALAITLSVCAVKSLAAPKPQ